MSFVKVRFLVAVVVMSVFISTIASAGVSSDNPNIYTYPGCDVVNKPVSSDCTELDTTIYRTAPASYKGVISSSGSLYIGFGEVRTNLEKNATYYFSAWILNTGGLPSLTITMRHSIAPGGVSSGVAMPLNPSNTTQWQKVEGTFVFKKSRTELFADGDNITYSDFYLMPMQFDKVFYMDDAVLRKVPTNATSFVSALPLENTINVPLASNVKFTFDNELDIDTLIPQNVLINNVAQTSADVDITYAINPNATVTATITPKRQLLPNTNYIVSIINTKDAWGRTLGNHQTQFTTIPKSTVQSYIFYKPNGSGWTQINAPELGEIKASVFLTNNLPTDANARLIMMVCVGTHIEKISVASLETIAAGGTKELIATVINDVPNSYIRLMMIDDGINKLQALTSVINFGTNYPGGNL